jgi:hypothetical protein
LVKAERSGLDITRADRLYFAAVGALALWVGGWGFLVPARVDEALPWLVPPLHARFLGAMYLSGTCFMVGALCARRWPTVRVVVPMISVWTGALFVVSLLNLPSFDFARPQAWVWFAAYLIYPLLAGRIAWRMRDHAERADGTPVPSIFRGCLVVQGIVLTGLALALFILPQAMSEVWPWSITTLLGQLYGAPFLSYGLGSILAARRRVYPELRLFLVGTAVFAGGVLLASALHFALFSTSQLATWVWFIGFGVLLLVQGAALATGSLHHAVPGRLATESSGGGWP